MEAGRTDNSRKSATNTCEVSTSINQNYMPQACPINIQSVLGRGLDEEVFGIVFPVFVEDTFERIPLCDAALRDDNIDQLKALAHSIIGSGANIGAVPFTEVARQIHSACNDNRKDKLPWLIEELRREWGRVEVYAVEQKWID